MTIYTEAFKEQFEGQESTWFEYRNRHTSTMVSGQGAITLTLPPKAPASPDEAPQLQSKQLCHYGTYEGCLRVARAPGQPKAGIVTGLFTYFNDQKTDTGASGIFDNSEIDFEWLAARPEEIILSVWTKYRSTDHEQRRATRIINLRTGEILYTRRISNFGGQHHQDIGPEGCIPETIEPIPDYNPVENYYTYGFSWDKNAVRWWIRDPVSNTARLLWDYAGGPGTIPANPARFMANVWHTPAWAPDAVPDALESNRVPAALSIKWLSYQPC